jgi:16S rRNA processing protein RimM
MAEAWDDYVQVGLITRPHGLRGEVLIRPDTDFPDERFAVGAQVFTRTGGGDIVPLTVRSHRTHLGRPLVAFVGRESLEAVEDLALSELRVPESALQPLPDGEYYWYQFVGAPVVTADGREVGVVARVDPTGGAGILVVEGADGEVQVPLVRDICTTLTPERIVVQAPDGLLELNAPTERRRESRHRHDIPRDGGGGLRRRRHRTGGTTRTD